MPTIEITHTLLATVGVAAGLVVCFFGYRLFKVVLGLLGFIAGGVLAGAAALFLVGDNTTVVLVVALVGGLISAVTLIWAYYVGMFLVGAAGGAVVGSAVGASIAGAWIEVAIIVGLAVIGGVLAIKVQRVILAIATAIIGSAGIVAGFLFFLFGDQVVTGVVERAAGGEPPDTVGWVVLGTWAAFAALGCGTQLGAGKKAKKSDD